MYDYGTLTHAEALVIRKNINGKDPNIPLLRKYVEWVEEQDALKKRGEDAEWEQGIYVAEHPCGTAFCVAGKIAHDVAGQHLVRADEETGELRAVESTELGLHVAAIAQLELRISLRDSYFLFAGHNSAAGVRAVAEEIAGERL